MMDDKIYFTVGLSDDEQSNCELHGVTDRTLEFQMVPLLYKVYFVGNQDSGSVFLNVLVSQSFKILAETPANMSICGHGFSLSCILDNKII